MNSEYKTALIKYRQIVVSTALFGILGLAVIISLTRIDVGFSFFIFIYGAILSVLIGISKEKYRALISLENADNSTHITNHSNTN